MAKSLCLNLGTSTQRSPFIKGVCTLTASPKPWNIGKITRAESPVLAPVWFEHCLATALNPKLDRRTPFGFPVVPPEYRITASSSALTG